MSFENTLIFPFPAVQYIPLPIKTMTAGCLPRIRGLGDKPLLIAGSQCKDWANSFKLALPETFPVNTCPVLAIHLSISTARYRSFFITMLGVEKPGSYQLFTIPSDRIYKEKLFFEAFEKDSGKRLARFSLFVASGISL